MTTTRPTGEKTGSRGICSVCGKTEFLLRAGVLVAHRSASSKVGLDTPCPGAGLLAAVSPSPAEPDER